MAAKAKTTLTAEQRATVDQLLKRYASICLFEVRNEKLFLLHEHWKYIDWKRDARRVLVCKKVATSDGYYYSTELI